MSFFKVKVEVHLLHLDVKTGNQENDQWKEKDRKREETKEIDRETEGMGKNGQEKREKERGLEKTGKK